jgi:calcineurin-like phosphoesterase family protein
MAVYFTSDTHFSHTNIIQFCNRPFSTIEEMNAGLISNWNSVVSPGDLVYHLGDVGFSHKTLLPGILEQLAGQKFLVLGNHDEVFIRGSLRDKLSRYFVKVAPVMEIKVPDPDKNNGRQRITLHHYAMKIWRNSHYGAWQLFGHSHGTLKDDPECLQIDIGVDCHNYKPISYDKVKELMSQKKYKPVDYHNSDLSVRSA